MLNTIENSIYCDPPVMCEKGRDAKKVSDRGDQRTKKIILCETLDTQPGSG